MNLIIIALSIIILGAGLQFVFKNKSKSFFVVTVSLVTSVLLSVSSFSAIRSLNSNYVNGVIGKINFTYVLDNIMAPFLFFIALSSFLMILWGHKFIEKNSGKYSFAILFLMFGVISFFCSVNAILFIIYLEMMLCAFYYLSKPGWKIFAVSQCGVLSLITAFLLVFLKVGSIEFGLFSEGLKPLVFGLFVVGFLICIIAVNFINKKTCDNLIKVIGSGIVLPVLYYGIVRMLFLWNNSDETVSYMILVCGFILAFWGIKNAKKSVDIQNAIINLSFKNLGIMLISLSVSTFGMILNNLPTAAVGMFGVYFLIFNQIILYPMALISSSQSEICEESKLMRFVPSNSFWFLISLLGISALPPLCGFIGEILLCTSLISGLEIKNQVLTILFLITLFVLFVVEVFAVIAVIKLLKSTVQVPKTFVNSLVLCIYALMILFVGLFPHIAVEFFISPVFVFMKGNLLVPQVVLSNISLINLSFIAMFFAVFLFRYLSNKKLKKVEDK